MTTPLPTVKPPISSSNTDIAIADDGDNADGGNKQPQEADEVLSGGPGWADALESQIDPLKTFKTEIAEAKGEDYTERQFNLWVQLISSALTTARAD